MVTFSMFDGICAHDAIVASVSSVPTSTWCVRVLSSSNFDVVCAHYASACSQFVLL
jgi:hypothetical protein